MSSPAGRPTIATVAALLEKLDGDFRDFRDEMRSSYVRVDVWRETIGRLNDGHAQLVEDFGGLKKRMDDQEQRSTDNRKWIIGAFVAPLVVGIVVALVVAAIVGA